MSKQEYDDAKLVAAVERESQSKTNQDVIAAAERQMQRWLLGHQGQESAAASRNAGSPTGIGPYLTDHLSGSRGWGSRVARLIGETIGWEVLIGNSSNAWPRYIDTLSPRWNVWTKPPPTGS